MCFDERDETRRTHLLLTFDEHLDVHAKLVAQSPERPVVDRDATSVIAGAAAIKPVTLQCGLKGCGIPFLLVGHRLHVMVGVQQHGRGVRIDFQRADHLPCARIAVLVTRLHSLGVHAHLAKLVRHIFRRFAHMLPIDAMRGDGTQCDAVLHHAQNLRPIGVHACANLICCQNHVRPFRGFQIV